MQENNYCVYKHTSPSNKVYIGITCQKPEYRWNNGRGYHQKYFKSAIIKYGWDNFKHEILFESLSKEEAEQKEIELIAFYKSNQREFGYNCSIGGENGCKGYHWHHSEETKRKMSIAKQNMSDETKQKISEAMKGKKPSEETRKAQIDAVKGKPSWNKGKCGIYSEETKQKMSESHKNPSEEHRRKLREARKGKKHTEETKRKMIETRQKKALAYKEYKANGGNLFWKDFLKNYTNLVNQAK